MAKMMIYLPPLLVLGGLLSLASRVRGEGGNEANIQIRGGSRYTAKTGVQVEKFEVLDNMRWMAVDLRIAVMKGTVAWQLFDPRGKAQWAGALKAGERLAEERRFQAEEGDWRLHLELAEATGDYRVRWRGRS